MLIFKLSGLKIVGNGQQGHMGGVREVVTGYMEVCKS